MLEGVLLANRYTLTELVDTGGSAFIYKAVDTKNNAVVAAKVLKPELADNMEFIDRFKKEVQVALRLKHANIICAFDAGMDGNQYYIIMDFIDGKTLKHIININKALPVKFVASVAKKLCLALEYAHVKGFIHRDIKPHNILIDMEGEPYIADFGIAKKITQSSGTGTIEEENVMGSVHYFSPEQARGEKVDKRSDIYSLGIVLYEMLTGTVPFDGETSVEIALKHLNQPMPEISDKTGEIPESVNRIIQKATQKDKDLRYKSAFAMYEDLNRCLAEPDGNYVKLQKKDPPENAPLRTNKKPQAGLRTILIGALGVLATIIILLLIFNMNFGQNVQSITVPNIVNATAQSAQNDVLAADLVPVVKNEFSNEIGMGLVIRQEPAPGTEVKEGQTVTIFVSAGPDLTVMPSVIGMPLEDAIEFLNKDDIMNIEVIEQTEGDYIDGTVISQVPAENDKIKDTDTVTLTVKAAPDTLTKKAPNVVGQPLTEALDTLKSSGFTKYYIYEEKNDKPSGIVFNQTPALNVSQEVNLPFTLWVSEYKNVYTLSKTLDFKIDDDNTYVTIALKVNINDSEAYFLIRESVENAGNLQLDISPVLGLPFEDETVNAQMVIFLNDIAVQTFDVTLYNGG